MKWAEYYERFYDWEESTQYNRLALIEDFGPETSPSSEIEDCIQYVDEKTANRLVKFAAKRGVRFTGEQVAVLNNSVFNVEFRRRYVSL